MIVPPLLIRRLIRRAMSRLRPRDAFVEVDGSVLPARDRRWCGPEFKDDLFYLKSAEKEAQRLVDEFGCTANTRVLDIGCGQGRLAIGLSRVLGEPDYTGMDIHQDSVAWCRQHIASRHPSCRFLHLDVQNDRYNTRGAPLDEAFRFPLDDGSVDIIYLYSVFSHMTEADMITYLREFRRILAPGGGIFFTTFVEDGVPDVSINPEGYRLSCSGPLHVVRYDRQHLESVIGKCGFRVRGFSYATEADGQSAIYMEPTSDQHLR